MKMGGGNKHRHHHHWKPVTHRLVNRACECGAVRKWTGKRWVVVSPAEKIFVRDIYNGKPWLGKVVCIKYAGERHEYSIAVVPRTRSGPDYSDLIYVYHVNWSSFGSVPPEHAKAYSAGLAQAAVLALTLTGRYVNRKAL
jgi:hypothetical protein